jgi:hypothetical protein
VAIGVREEMKIFDTVFKEVKKVYPNFEGKIINQGLKLIGK